MAGACYRKGLRHPHYVLPRFHHVAKLYPFSARLSLANAKIPG